MFYQIFTYSKSILTELINDFPNLKVRRVASVSRFVISLSVALGLVARLFTRQMNEGVVSKETVVLRRWGSSIQKFGFINGVDNVNWPPYRDSKS